MSSLVLITWIMSAFLSQIGSTLLSLLSIACVCTVNVSELCSDQSLTKSLLLSHCPAGIGRSGLPETSYFQFVFSCGSRPSVSEHAITTLYSNPAIRMAPETLPVTTLLSNDPCWWSEYCGLSSKRFSCQ